MDIDCGVRLARISVRQTAQGILTGADKMLGQFVFRLNITLLSMHVARARQRKYSILTAQGFGSYCSVGYALRNVRGKTLCYQRRESRRLPLTIADCIRAHGLHRAKQI